jgi:hypothetical protein
MTFSRTIEVRHDVDVCVVGGGPAGVAAAVAAARQGRSVFVLEGQGCFGGMGTAGMLPLFCDFSDGVHFVADGIGREVYNSVWDAGGAAPGLDRANNVLFHQPEPLKRVYDDLVANSGATFALYTQAVAAESRDGRVETLICHGKSGLFAVRAKAFVDCSGDGDLCAWAGAPFEKGDADGNMMPGTLCSIWAGIDWDAANAAGHGNWGQQPHLPRAIADGVFSIPDRHLPGIVRIGRTLGGGNVGHTFGVDGTDERSLTQASMWGRKLLLEYQRFYKEYLTGYADMELAYTAPQHGIRETRRILGDYVLGLDDFLARAVFPDEIGRFCYPVDIHATKPDDASFEHFEEEFKRLRYEKGETYGIPYRSLTPRGLKNVLVAGRSLSADRYVQGSVRVMPGCFITGQAAGVAAALAVETGIDTPDVHVATLQARLLALGAYLPNA